MFFHHPETEESLRRMARTALHGAAMERSDLRLWPRLQRVFKWVAWEIGTAYVLCLLVGLKSPVFRDAAWRDFMLAGALLLTSRMSGSRFYWLLQSSPTMGVLWHLPVSGRDICLWARRRYWLSSLKLLPRMGAAAWAWLGFPALGGSWVQVLGYGVLLWFVMLACVQLESGAQPTCRLLRKFWTLMLVVWVGLAIYFWYWNQRFTFAQHLPPWLIQVCAPASWVLPARWAMHAAESHIALAGTLASLALGALLWWRFADFAGLAYDRLAVNESKERMEPEARMSASEAMPEPAAVQPVQVLASIEQAAVHETSLAGEGWIEKLALALLHDRDRMLAPILVGLKAGWTARWWKGLRMSALLLFSSYVLLAFGELWNIASIPDFWIMLLTLGVIMTYFFPASNSISVATAKWPLGQQAMPVFAALPISMRDLQRVSFRITAARMIACLALSLPLIAAQCLLLKHAEVIPMALGMTVVVGASWVAVRPAFIYYWLQEMCRPAHGRRVGHFCATLLMVPLALATLFSIFADLGLSQAHPAWPLVCLPVTACCARAIYAIFHWRVRTQKVDWVIEP